MQGTRKRETGERKADKDSIALPKWYKEMITDKKIGQQTRKSEFVRNIQSNFIF